jgi:hypothetical protein
MVIQDTLKLVEKVAYSFFQRIYTSERKEMLWVNKLSWEYGSEKCPHMYTGYAGFKAHKIIIKMSKFNAQCSSLCLHMQWYNIKMSNIFNNKSIRSIGITWKSVSFITLSHQAPF